ncbi:MAG: hypothetical protein U0974_02930 [Gemmatimonadales bacterium]|nr:hypothetical protein [Gemmatimonadales bacterium]MDZ4388668.1 hypothetical protein [Gemmatimonadales bacterium]
MRLLVHESVITEYTDSNIDQFLAKVMGAVARRLQLTAGSTLKTLRGPYNGTAFRCRVGDRRIPLSVVEAEEQRWVVIHQVAHRKGVYQSHEFRSRLENFHDHMFDHDNGTWLKDPCDQDYVELDVPTTKDEPSGHASVLEPWLSSEQSQVLTGLLPFPTTWGAQDAVLMVAKGAPGSGKTLVAAELADVAANQCNYTVKLLVPTLKLKEHYAQWLGTGPIGDNLTIDLVQEYFQDYVGNIASEPARLNALRLWWQDVLELPALNAWVNRNPIVRSARFLALVDAALISDLKGVLTAKDALDAADENLYKRLSELSGNAKWMHHLESLQANVGLTLRCQAARSARSESVDGDGRPLLIIVDECQDLVPEEWQSLMRMVADRRRLDKGTRIALLGDEAQRLAPTSFAWADLFRFANDELNWPDGAAHEVVLPGSYRVPRAIGEMGVRVFKAPLGDLGKSRHVDLVDVAKLPAGGDVFLLAYDRGGDSLQMLERAFAVGGDSKTLVMIDTETATDAVPPMKQVERLPIAMAKGLEFSSIVINPPFAGALPMPFDRAAALYTALTRATARVLCLVPLTRWDEVTTAFTGLSYTALNLDGAASRQEAVDVLRSLAQQTSIEELTAVMIARISGSLEELRLTTRTAESRALVREIVRDAGSLVQLEQLQSLGTELAHEARDLSDLKATIDGLDELSPEEIVAGLLLTGQYGAVMTLLRGSQVEKKAAWHAEVMKMAAEEQSHLEQQLELHGGERGRPIRERLASVIEVILTADPPVASMGSESETAPRTVYEAELAAELQGLRVQLEDKLTVEDSGIWAEDDDAIRRAISRVDNLAIRLNRLAEEMGLAA